MVNVIFINFDKQFSSLLTHCASVNAFDCILKDFHFTNMHFSFVNSSGNTLEDNESCDMNNTQFICSCLNLNWCNISSIEMSMDYSHLFPVFIFLPSQCYSLPFCTLSAIIQNMLHTLNWGVIISINCAKKTLKAIARFIRLRFILNWTMWIIEQMQWV